MIFKKKDEETKDKNEETKEKGEEEKEKDEEIKEKDEETNKNNEEMENEKYFLEIIIDEKIHTGNYYTDILEYIIEESCNYKICVYGANAEKGGKGCSQCAESYFKKGSIIQYRLGGKTSGGEGGKECGWSKGNAYNGAGASWANYSNSFYIVAGGGGGNSEKDKKKGGDCEQDGEGKYGGKGATKDEYGKGGNSPNEDGKKDKGGKGGEFTGLLSVGKYCGGGGGDGYYGGGGGDSESGGGGGSSYCQKSIGVSCEESHLNKYVYSSIKI